MKKLNFTGVSFHQGDVEFFKLNPSSAKDYLKNKSPIKKSFIARSEKSGSVHALCGNYEMFECEDGFIVDVKEPCILNHTLESMLKNMGIALSTSEVLPKKDHRHTVVEKGVYFVGIQQRFDPLSGFKTKVKD